MSTAEKSLSPKQVAERYSVSRSTAERWIIKMNDDEETVVMKDRRVGKRPWRLRRIKESILEREIDKFINH